MLLTEFDEKLMRNYIKSRYTRKAMRMDMN